MFAKVYKDNTKFYTEETIEAGCDQGIFVDIFPYDQLAEDSAQKKKQIRNARIWQSILYPYYTRTIVVPHKGLLGTAERNACKIAHSLVSSCSILISSGKVQSIHSSVRESLRLCTFRFRGQTCPDSREATCCQPSRSCSRDTNFPYPPDQKRSWKQPTETGDSCHP